MQQTVEKTEWLVLTDQHWLRIMVDDTRNPQESWEPGSSPYMMCVWWCLGQCWRCQGVCNDHDWSCVWRCLRLSMIVSPQLITLQHSFIINSLEMGEKGLLKLISGETLHLQLKNKGRGSYLKYELLFMFISACLCPTYSFISTSNILHTPLSLSAACLHLFS